MTDSSVKVYLSYTTPTQHVDYTNEILDGGHQVEVVRCCNEKGPLFSVTASDDPDHPIRAQTATACWTTILQRVSKERKAMGLSKTGTAVSGPEFFGYAMPEIAACIEGLEGAEQCKKYVPRCLRMETSRKGRVRPVRDRVAPIAETPMASDVGERPTKRRAAQMASKRWKSMEEEESAASTDNDEDEEEEEEEILSDAESDSEESSGYSSKKSTKRSKRTEVLSKEPREEDNAKRVRTEELC